VRGIEGRFKGDAFLSREIKEGFLRTWGTALRRVKNRKLSVAVNRGGSSGILNREG